MDGLESKNGEDDRTGVDCGEAVAEELVVLVHDVRKERAAAHAEHGDVVVLRERGRAEPAASEPPLAEKEPKPNLPEGYARCKHYGCQKDYLIASNKGNSKGEPRRDEVVESRSSSRTNSPPE